MNNIFKIVPYLVIALLVGVTASYAGSLTPPGPAGNTMYTLSDIFNLSTGTTTSEGTGSIDSTPGSISATGKTLTEVYTTISTEIAKLSNAKIAKDQTAFGYTGTLYGDTDPAKVLTTATYAGTAVAGTPPTEWAAADMPDPWTHTWADGVNYCANLTEGGHTDWRLPYAWELIKLQKSGFTTGSPELGGSAGLEEGGYWLAEEDTSVPATYALLATVGRSFVEGAEKANAWWNVRCAR